MADTSELTWEQLESSHVDAMAYLPEEAILLVKFSTGAVYRYPADAEEADGLRKAASPGRYVHYFLKHKGERVE